MRSRIALWALAAVVFTAMAAVTADGGESADRSWLKAVVICGLHLLAARLRPILDQRADLVNSFAGGMSVTYVFGHLIPELSEGHEHVGELIYLVVLVGFVVYYGLERRVRITGRRSEHRAERLGFNLTLRSYWLYNWLVVFGLPDGASGSFIHVVLITVAMVLHLAHRDYELGSQYPVFFDRRGRLALALAPLVGLLCRAYLRPEEELVRDIFTAVLAGSVIFSVFKSELTDPEKTDFRGFLVGIVTYATLIMLTRRFV